MMMRHKYFVLRLLHNPFFTLGTSHCVDMYANEPGDPEELVAAREKIGDLVAKWVIEAN